MSWMLVLACSISGQAESPQYLGVSSCTATACHGRAESAGRPTWQSSYTVWTARDPHAGAYAVLFGDRSRRIVGALAGSELRGDGYSKFLQQKCIGCHAASQEPALLADGVSCEACHGPAEKWVSSHTRRTTRRPAEMHDTLTLSSRARICADCHVGPRHVGDRLFDVNHDLIAAGHPRLTFEFNAYLSSLPPHWRADHTKLGAEAWSVGQAAAAQASLNLLAARTHGPLWPELAEYDCYACHHGLQPGREPAGSRPGRPEWGVWGLVGNKQLQTLREEMLKPLPDRATVWRLATEAAQQIEPLEPNAETLRSQMPQWRHWEEWAQAYLAADAIADQDRQPQRRQLRCLLEVSDGFDTRDRRLQTALEELLKP
jgi:hypothetical protein